MVAYWTVTRMVGRVVYPRKRLARIVKERVRLKEMPDVHEVSFSSSDGTVLAGFLIVRDGARCNLLGCHGYRQSKEFGRYIVDLFPKDNVLLFDFRAHGESEGHLVTIGHREKRDVQAALAFLQQHPQTKNLPTSGVGISMGAASLIGAAAQGAPFASLVLDSSFARLQEHLDESFVFRTGLPKIPFMSIGTFFFELLAGFSVEDHNPCERIRSVSCPVFVIHSKSDCIVSVGHAHKLYQNAGDNKQLWIVENAWHGKAYQEHRKGYVKRVRSFLEATVT